MSDQFPTVGLKADLTGLVAADPQLDKTKKKIDEVAVAADNLARKSRASAATVVGAENQASTASRNRAASAERAAQTEERARARLLKEVQRGVAAAERAARQDQATARNTLAFKSRMWAQQLAEEKRAAQEQLRITRELAKAQAALGTNSLGGGGAGFFRSFGAGLSGLRQVLGETRRLFFDLRTAVSVFLGGLVVAPVIRMADAMTALRARVSAFAEKQSDVPIIMASLYQSAQRARMPLEALGQLYARLAPMAQQLGKSQMDLLRVTETVGKGLTIGGATPEEAKSSAQQLAQALASNRLGGDELRSLAENAPILLGQIAKSLNMNTGQFIKWAQSGKANAAVVVQAIQDAGPRIDAIFAKMPMTIQQGMTLIGNAITNLIDQVNQATGTSERIANALAGIADFIGSEQTIDAVAKAVSALAIGLELFAKGVRLAVAFAPALAAAIALLAVRAITGTAAFSAMQIGMYMAGNQVVALAAKMRIGAAAMTGAAAAARGVMALFGGPLGIAIIAVATAWSLYASNVQSAQQVADKFTDAQDGVNSAVERAIAFHNTYGGSTEDLIALQNKLSGVTEDQMKGLDDAGQAAMRRAGREKMLTASLLERAAAESIAAAASLRRGATVDKVMAASDDFGAATVIPLTKSARAMKQKFAASATQRRQNAAYAEELASTLMSNVPTLMAEAKSIRNSPIELPAISDGGGGGGGTKDKATRDSTAQRIAEVEKAIAQSMQNELSARADLTGDIMARAQIEQQIIDAEVAERVAALQGMEARLAADKHLDPAKAKILKLALQEAEKAEGRAGEDRKEKVRRDALLAVEERQLQRQQQADALMDQADQARKETAATAEQLNAIEQDQLNRRQAAETRQLENDLRRQTQNEGLDEAYAEWLYGLQQVAHQVEQEVQKEAARVRLVNQQASIEQALVEQKLDLLNSQRNAARSDYEAAKIRLRMLPLEEQLERLKLEQIRDAAKEGSPERAAAEAALKNLPEIQKNNRRIAEEQANLINGIADAATAFAGLVEQLKHGNLGTVLTSMSNVFSELSGLAGQDSGIGKALGSIASFLGPAGALVTAVGSVLGAIFSSNKVIGIVRLSSEDQRALQGVGTVLGSFKEQSESISNALATAETYQDQDLQFASTQVAYLKAIRDNISNLTAVLGRQIGVTGGAFDTSGLGLGTTTGHSGDILSGLVGLLFGKKKVTTTLVDQGLNLGSGNLQDYINAAVGMNSYQDTQTVTEKSKLFGFIKSTTTANNEFTQPLDEDATRSIARVMKSMQDSVLDAARIIGIGTAEEFLKTFQVEIGRISLDGLSADEITKQLTAVFSKVGDEMAAGVLPGIEAFQKAGEGAFETLQRLATEYEAVDAVMATMGKTFKLTGLASLEARDRLVQLFGGLEGFTASTDFFTENFLSQAERLAAVQKAVDSRFAELGKNPEFSSLLTSVPTTREEFKNLVLGLDLTTDAGQDLFAALMKMAPAFAAVTQAGEDMAEKLTELSVQAWEDATNKVDEARQTLIDSYNREKQALEDTKEKMQGFVDTLQAFDEQLANTSFGDTDMDEARARAELMKTFDTIQNGTGKDRDDAFGKLQGVSEDYLKVAEQTSKSAAEYAEKVAQVRNIVQTSRDLAEDEVNIANQQLDLLKQQVQQFVDLNENVISVQQAIGYLAQAIATANKLGTIKDPHWGAIQNIAVNKKLADLTGYTGDFGGGGFSTFIDQQSLATRSAARDLLVANGQASRVDFSTADAQWGDYHNIDANKALAAATGYSDSFGGGKFQAWIVNQDAAIKNTARAILQQYNQPERIAFAKGGAFDQGVLTRPFQFDMGEAGEAGPEAILPLSRTADGGLGVKAVSGGSTSNEDVCAELAQTRRLVMAIAVPLNTAVIKMQKDINDIANQQVTVKTTT